MWFEILGQVGDIIAQGGDGWHDEEDAVRIAEFDKCRCLIKMVSGGSWSERMGCQSLCCLPKLDQHQGKALKLRLQIIREMKQCLWQTYSDDSLFFKNDIYPIPESLAQMIAAEGISRECEGLTRNTAHYHSDIPSSTVESDFPSACLTKRIPSSPSLK